MLSLDRQNEYRERYRQMYDGWRTSNEIYESLVQRCIKKGGHRARVLDLGCGAGGVMEVFGRQVSLSVGVDPDWTSLIQHRDPVTSRVTGTAARLPFADETFDLVTSSWVLEHLADPCHAFAEVARVLNPGGHFVFLTPNARHPVAFLNRLIPRWVQGALVRLLYGRGEKDTFPTVYAANTVDTIDALAEKVELRREQLHLVRDPTYLAFNEGFFYASMLLERVMPSGWAVHIVGEYAKSV